MHKDKINQSMSFNYSFNEVTFHITMVTVAKVQMGCGAHRRLFWCEE